MQEVLLCSCAAEIIKQGNLESSMIALMRHGVFAAGLLLIFGSTARAELFILQPVEDTFLASDDPNATFGAQPLLQTEGWVSLGARRSLFKFDLSGIPDGITLLSARLKLEQVGLAQWSGFPVEAYRLSNDGWNESTASWSSYDQSGASILASLNGPQDPGLRTFELNLANWDYAADLLDDSVTLQTRWGDELSQQYKRLNYSSREGLVVPVLEIEAVPEPAGWALLGFGVAALVFRRRAHRR